MVVPPNMTINDREAGKFELNSYNEVQLKTETVLPDLINEPEWTLNDLEFKKFNTSGEVRIVLTI